MLNQLLQRNQVLLKQSNEVKDSFTRESEDNLSHIELDSDDSSVDLSGED